jgi:uncharacterized protein YbjT (DUF2867 family)
MPMKRTIAVMGATGKQGGAVAQALISNGSWHVRAITRDPTSAVARRLEAAGAELMPADMDDLESLKRGLAGAYGAYSVQGTDRGSDIETARGIDVAEAARFTGVKHFVYSSVGGAERNTGIAHFESKWRVEEYIRAFGLQASIVRPTFFMDNFAKPSTRLVTLALLRSYVPENKPLQMVAATDIGRWVSDAFARPDIYIGAAEELAGDSLTPLEIIRAFKRHGWLTGLPFSIPRVVLRPLPAEVRGMFQWFGAAGYQADLAELRSKRPDLQRLDDWLLTGVQQ